MIKHFTHIGVSLALILPPLPLNQISMPQQKNRDTLTFQESPCQKPMCHGFLPEISGYTVPKVPTTKVFSNTVNGLTVTTAIANTQDQLTQSVVMHCQKETVRFKLALENRDTLTFDQFIFSQAVHDSKNIVTKEWIVAEKPNVQGGSVYAWRLSSVQDISLKKLSDQRIHILQNNEVVIATIEPFVYWTRHGVMKQALVIVDKVNNRYEIKLNIQESSSSYPLYIDPTISYGQWLGDGSVGTSTVAAVAVETVTGEIYVGGTANGNILAAVSIAGTYNGATAGYVAEVVSANPPVVNWMHYIGGSAGAVITSLAINTDEIYAGGYTAGTGTASWVTAVSTIGTLGNGLAEAFVVEILDGSPPTLNWRHWIGGTGGGDVITSIAVNGEEVYAGGYAASSTQWETAGSTAGTHNSGTEAFLEEITDGSPPSLTFHMWLGGAGTDNVNALAVNGDEVYAGGYSASSDSWDTAGSLVGTFTNPSINEGFVVEVADGSPPRLEWLMWLGGDGIDVVNAIAVNADEIYAGGYSNSSDSWDTAGSIVGTVTNSGNPGEGFVVEIADGGPPTLDWIMWLGSPGLDQINALVVNNDEIYAAGYSNSSSSWDTLGSMVGTFIAGTSANGEGFVVEIQDGSPPTINWLMWLGGRSADPIYGIAVNGDAIFSGSYATLSSSIDTFSTISGTFFAGGNNTAYLAEFTDGSPPTYFWLQWLTGSGDSQVNALAVTGEEIYAGGYSYGQTLGTVTDVGTPNYVQEGFVVEVADGASPSLNWRVWLGGDGASVVNALAVNADEIYAGGYSNASASWDTVGSTVGTLTNITSPGEGFVVEIADGSPPTVAWRAWLGGESADTVTALSVNGDEIYAGGYTYRISSWETFGAVVGTLTNNQEEGFIVEIADGSPPTYEWLVFLGGVNHDYIYSIAVTGDEIYAGGGTDSSASWDTFVSTMGTMTNTSYEGFLVEIGDAATPTLEWHTWLGGSSHDRVYAVAVNGDEVYAGGYADDPLSFETAAITFGTETNTADAGFVVEVADGSPPSLAWRMWIGGSANDGVRTLAVNGDEIYAGGYSNSSGNWATVDSVIGTFTQVNVTEGFITNIVDGSPPSMKWIVWLGGTGADDVNVLAVNGTEVYAGGYIPITVENEGTYSGTKYDGHDSGFIVEIADDSTATVNSIFFGMGF